MNPTIEVAMAYPWQIEITPRAEGGFVGLVKPRLPDLEIVAETREEIEAEWRDALESHLQAYIACEKVIPVAHARLQPEPRHEPEEGHGKTTEETIDFALP